MARKSKPKSKAKAHVAAVVKSEERSDLLRSTKEMQTPTLAQVGAAKVHAAVMYRWKSQDRPLIKPVHEVLKGKETFTLDDISRAITASKLKRTVGNVVSVWTRYGLIQEVK